MDKKVKIGVIPVRRDVMLKENAFENKCKVMNGICDILDESVQLVDIEDISNNGVLIDNYDEIEKIEKKMKTQNVDSVFFPHLDFGTEESVGKLGKRIGKPLLLWGPRDENCGTFFRAPIDIQCGLFASSKALQRYDAPFSYIENSAVTSEKFKKGFETFCRTTSIVKGMKKLRIGQVGMRPRQFQSVIFNEDDIMNKFGIEVVPISIQSILVNVKALVAASDSNMLDTVENIRERMKCSLTDDVGLRNIAALKLTLLKIVGEFHLDAISLECWSAFVSTLGIMVCHVVGELTDLGIPVACETDTMGAITSILLQSATQWKTPTFFADLTVRHPQNDNSILLWHCGPFPESLRDKNCSPYLVQGTGMWKLKDGDITIARFDGVGGKYSLTFDEGVSVEGPRPNGNYIWYETENFSNFEEKFIFGPYIHHVAGTYGHYARALHEACKYIPFMDSDPIKEIKGLGL